MENEEDKEVREPQKSKVSITAIKSTKSIGALHKKSMSRMRMRRQSYGFSGVPGIKPIERTSQLAIEFKRPPLLYLNTYQLEPHIKFDPNKIEITINKMLDEHFQGHKYNVQESPAYALRLSGELMRKMKTYQFNRYRVFTVVTIGQKRAQSYNNAIAFLWDHERDGYVDVHREFNELGRPSGKAVAVRDLSHFPVFHYSFKDAHLTRDEEQVNQDLRAILMVCAAPYSTVAGWCADEFKRGRTSTNDEPLTGRLTSAFGSD